jgi:hypothetical protein
MSILDWGPFSRIRRNHALEHATLQVMAERQPGLRMAGYSDTGGFWLVGHASIEQIQAGAEQALRRLEGGEYGLAIHPNCGTNFVASGMLAGSFAWLSLVGARNFRSKLERFPMVVSLVTVALVLAQPLGPWLQARVTTAAAPRGMQVTGITRSMRGELPMHRILTRG